jgi:hypothetical protein
VLAELRRFPFGPFTKEAHRKKTPSKRSFPCEGNARQKSATISARFCRDRPVSMPFVPGFPGRKRGGCQSVRLVRQWVLLAPNERVGTSQMAERHGRDPKNRLITRTGMTPDLARCRGNSASAMPDGEDYLARATRHVTEVRKIVARQRDRPTSRSWHATLDAEQTLEVFQRRRGKVLPSVGESELSCPVPTKLATRASLNPGLTEPGSKPGRMV